MVKKSQQIKDRIDWLKGLYEDIVEDVKDRDIAKIIYKRVVFEE